MNQASRIYVAGAKTLLGRALVRRLREEGHANVIPLTPNPSPPVLRGRGGPDNAEPDLTVRAQVEDFFGEHRPEYVFVAAGLSGGIALNRERPADLMLDNLLVAAHLLDAAHTNGVRKLLYLASSCSYPKYTPQPMKVESLLSGPVEPTNAAYATAKLAGWQLARAYRQQHGANFITAIPANAFGPGDDFGTESGHVIPALIRRAHEAKRHGEPTLTVWGSGTPRREFIAASDVADACIHLMRHYDREAPINVGNSTSYTIAEVAHLVAEVVGYEGKLVFDPSQPDGMPLKMLDSTPLFESGWRPRTDFRSALTETYDWFLQHEVMEDPRMYLRLYRSLYRIRRVEEEIARAYPTDKIKSPVHLSIGQEAVSVGVCEALQPHDVVFGTYRGHALYLAKGGDLKAMIAELYGKATGCTKGKGGSMHLVDAARGVMGTSAVVGTTIANAVGYAYALRYRQTDAIVASFFGDGATEEGVFAESLNFAALKTLPILFVCENNGYAIHTHQSRRQGSQDICAKARAFGLPAERIDGNDIEALVNRAEEVVAKIRTGAGPHFFEVTTYRLREHVGPGTDYHLGYRDENEAAPWVERDAVVRVGQLLDARERACIEDEVEEEIADAFAFAEASRWPAREELPRDVFQEV